MRTWGILFWLGVVVSVLAQGFGPGRVPSLSRSNAEFPGWPQDLAPAEALPVAVTGLPANLISNGFTRVSVCSTETWLVRWLPRIDRASHPAADCFRANGFRLTPARLVLLDGISWQEFTASRRGECWRVRQRWIGSHGENRTDVSSWFWASRAGSPSGWTVVRVTPG